MVKNKQRSASFWSVLKVLVLAPVIASCLLPISYLPTNSSSTSHTINHAALQTDTVQYPETWHPIDLKNETSLEKWMHKENEKSTEDKIKDIFKQPENFDYHNVERLNIVYPGALSEHPDWIKIEVELIEGKSFPDGQHAASWEAPLSKWEKIDRISRPISWIDLKNKQTIVQWINAENKKKMSEKIDDLVNENNVQLITKAASDLKIERQGDCAHISLMLNDGYSFVNPTNPHDMFQEWNITFANEIKLIQEPTFKSVIDLNGKTGIKNWAIEENRKSIAEKIADLFSDQNNLSEQNVGSITLNIDSNENPNTSVLSKAELKFNDDNNLRLKDQIALIKQATLIQNPAFNFTKIGSDNQTSIHENNGSFDSKISRLFVTSTELADENVDVKETTSINVTVTVTLKDGYIFIDGTDSKTSTISLINPVAVSKTKQQTQHSNTLVGGSIATVIFGVVAIALIIVWTTRKQQQANKLNLQLEESKLQKKLALNKLSANKENIRLSNHQNAKKAIGKAPLQKAKFTVQKKSSSSPNVKRTTPQQINSRSPIIKKSVIKKQQKIIPNK